MRLHYREPTMPAQTSRYRVALITSLILAGLLLSMYWAGRIAEQRAWTERSQEAAGQLELYAQAIHTQVQRFRSVPALLALDSDIQALLNNPSDQALREQLNHRLEEQNQAAGSSVLYLLDRHGETLAASNWRDWSSFVGNNYAFRPYFIDAVANDSGRYFAVGVTTGIPGYFLSSSVKNANGEVIGVLVVKLELEDMQREWVGQSGILLISDSLDIVILTNRPAWRFRYLRPLSDAVRDRLVAVRRYAEQNLQPLASQSLQRIADNSERRLVDGPDGRRDYLWQRLALPEEDWTLHLLQEPQLVAANVRSYRLAAAGVWMTLAFLLLYLAQRRKTLRVERRSRNELERLVEERTRELNTAQDELVHAARMAALGQMSAALAHEINQPLTALRMQLASQRLLLDSGRTDAARRHRPGRRPARTHGRADQSPEDLRAQEPRRAAPTIEPGRGTGPGAAIARPAHSQRRRRGDLSGAVRGLGQWRCNSPGAGADQPADQRAGRHVQCRDQNAAHPLPATGRRLDAECRRQRWWHR